MGRRIHLEHQELSVRRGGSCRRRGRVFFLWSSPPIFFCVDLHNRTANFLKNWYLGVLAYALQLLLMARERILVFTTSMEVPEVYKFFITLTFPLHFTFHLTSTLLHCTYLTLVSFSLSHIFYLTPNSASSHFSLLHFISLSIFCYLLPLVLLHFFYLLCFSLHFTSCSYTFCYLLCILI